MCMWGEGVTITQHWPHTALTTCTSCTSNESYHIFITTYTISHWIFGHRHGFSDRCKCSIPALKVAQPLKLTDRPLLTLNSMKSEFHTWWTHQASFFPLVTAIQWLTSSTLDCKAYHRTCTLPSYNLLHTYYALQWRADWAYGLFVWHTHVTWKKMCTGDQGSILGYVIRYRTYHYNIIEWIY